MAVAVLLDESGHMGHKDRYKYAQAAAIHPPGFLFTSAYSDDGVWPQHIPGDLVDLYSYVEYDVFADLDRYRLADIQARRSNRDGAALRYVSGACWNGPNETRSSSWYPMETQPIPIIGGKPPKRI